MCQFLETIQLCDGQFMRLPRHQFRLEKAMADFYPAAIVPSLSDKLAETSFPTVGLYKCRVIYDSEIRLIEFHPYVHPVISTLKIVETDIYKDYMASDDNSYEADRELWRKIYKTYIFNNDSLDQVLEDQSLYWNDDKEIVDTFVLKTIKRFDEKKGANQELLPEFKDDEDQEFARRLFRRTILNSDYYRHLVSENTKNWDLDRIAFMDVIIMQTALAEILSFPNIPVSVSLNEYVEIAKLYSTAKSGSFINGTLDGIVNQLKKEGKLTKN